MIAPESLARGEQNHAASRQGIPCARESGILKSGIIGPERKILSRRVGLTLSWSERHRPSRAEAARIRAYGISATSWMLESRSSVRRARLLMGMTQAEFVRLFEVDNGRAGPNSPPRTPHNRALRVITVDRRGEARFVELHDSRRICTANHRPS